ncbi:MAG: methylated-DNA--[protein]-cysteine S-methyltransferase [Oscillospiraceae bacterium]|jgi:methylated-DNA-[protein]-cysteine S-methyltransferase|nr:methylated-DNA--[protein]-cysteine S-methyltransferase [Oscillospiraceae bacterium]MCI1990428.1 methylated-DNA--[protein]-cysteine S-methyltransferase [Oscillospiraceae bacterium]MCI2035177.1 methylated-DNA--[protein]-cysteine S-methyltransferase [Oscillospiraceae bacterium]
MKHVWYWDSPIGTLGIAENGTGMTDLFLRGRIRTEGFREEKTPLIQDAVSQLREYFGGKRKAFNIPLSLSGTAFQLSDWKALRTIPYGETRSYQQIAEQLGNPKACRAVGMVNNRNPVLIVVPCHRVIGKDGSLTGYGCGLEKKELLLELERRFR